MASGFNMASGFKLVSGLNVVFGFKLVSCLNLGSWLPNGAWLCDTRDADDATPAFQSSYTLSTWWNAANVLCLFQARAQLHTHAFAM